MAKLKAPVMLVILDGFGMGDQSDTTNAVVQAKPHCFNQLWDMYPHTKLEASGLAVGLPEGQMGNSEVGHLNLGSGRIVYQDLTRITKDVESGEFYNRPVMQELYEVAKKQSLHLIGLVSDGNVHCSLEHIKAVIKGAHDHGIEHVYVHALLDGRDVAPQCAQGYLKDLEAYMAELNCGKIATVSGRYYAMDRDNRWDRVELAYNAIVNGQGERAASVCEAVQQSYDKDAADEFVLPTVIEKDGQPTGVVSDKDSVVFFNFRPDRAREITRAFCDDDFQGFERKARPQVTFVCFTDYDDTIQNKQVAFHKVQLHNTFGEYLAAHNMTQARIAETEKYAHVTFFFNGGVEEPNKGEDRILVKSPKVATYDLQPEMSAPQVCEKLVDAIKSDKYDVIVINFANPDMVGHTGVQEAAIKAVETVDECVGKAVEALKEVDGQMFICADHGNAEQLIDYETGAPWTAHTTNPVPFILVNADPKYTLRENGCLADIVPTLIQLMGMEQPAEMTGKSLLVEK